MTRERVDAVMTRLLASDATGRMQFAELMDAHAMALRIMDRLPDADVYVAVFIALKAECVYSPFSHTMLVRFTGADWKALQRCEVAILRGIDWRLYGGALTPLESPAHDLV